MKKGAVFYLTIFFIVFGIVEFSSYWIGIYLQSKGVIYKAQTDYSYVSYMSVRDSILGWPNPKSFGNDSDFDESGSRIIPAFPDPDSNKTPISMYGDSYTYGDEVSNEYSIANQLSLLLNQRVANYGVGGYGTDQSLLRFLSNSRDSAKIVVINHFVIDIIRNVNQYRDIIASAGGVGFKPVFIINNNNQLEVVPIIKPNCNNFNDIIKNPENYFNKDFFINRMSGAFIKLKFPYFLSIVKSFNNYRVKTKITGKLFYYDFYNYNHPSNSLEITKRILVKFYHETVKRNKYPIIAITPSEFCFKYYKENNEWPYENLIKELEQYHIKVFNIGQAILTEYSEIDFDNLYFQSTGHFNEHGNKVVASVFYKYLEQRIDSINYEINN